MLSSEGGCCGRSLALQKVNELAVVGCDFPVLLRKIRHIFALPKVAVPPSAVLFL